MSKTGILKENAQTLSIKEQTIYNDISGLTIKFSAAKDSKGFHKIQIFGENLEYGNRDFFFLPNGVCDGAGISLTECPVLFGEKVN